MSPRPHKKKGRKRRGKGYVASADLATTPGRGRNVPRVDLGHDTLLGLAQSQRRTLAYVTAATFNSGAAGAYAESTFVLNNPFAPLPGQSAVGYAKYMAFYSKAFVLGARITVHSAGATTTPVVHGLLVSTNATSFGSLAAAITNGMVDYRVGATNPDRYTLTQSVDIAVFLNKPNVLDDPQLYCTPTSGPSQVVVAHVFTQCLGALVNLSGVVEIEFDVVFTDPIPFS